MRGDPEGDAVGEAAAGLGKERLQSSLEGSHSNLRVGPAFLFLYKGFLSCPYLNSKHNFPKGLTS